MNRDYFDLYLSKCNDWVNIHSQQINMFEVFLNDLDVYKTSADSLAAMWSARIGIRESY